MVVCMYHNRTGRFWLLRCKRTVPTDYSAANVETINLIKSIPNHNDDGTLAPSV